jgi:hypothetical protein
MTASTRFWKRHNSQTTAPVTLSVSCSIDPPKEEPIQLRLRADDDGLLAGAHFVMTMSYGEAASLCKQLNSYLDHLDHLSKYAPSESRSAAL